MNTVNPLAHSSPLFGRAVISACLAAGLLSPVQAQNPLNALQQLLQQGQQRQQPPARNAPIPGGANAAAAGLLNLVAPTATPAANAPAGGAADLIKLLSQSLEQIDQPKEIEIGRQLAAVLLGSKPMHPDMVLQRYVNRLGRWISLQSSRPDLPWTFVVLDDAGYNAFAAPGGYVFLTKGLIDRVGDESELAGILAHEITHVTEKHHLKALRKSAQSGLLAQALTSQLSGSLGAGLSSQLLAMGRDVYSKGLDQEDEYEADRAGVALAARAGFDPFGLLAALHQLRTVAADNAAFTLTMSTHPPAQNRMDALEAAMGNRLDALSGKPPVALAQRLGR